jgi:hypothetical protein
MWSTTAGEKEMLMLRPRKLQLDIGPAGGILAFTACPDLPVLLERDALLPDGDL